MEATLSFRGPADFIVLFNGVTMPGRGRVGLRRKMPQYAAKLTQQRLGTVDVDNAFMIQTTAISENRLLSDTGSRPINENEWLPGSGYHVVRRRHSDVLNRLFQCKAGLNISSSQLLSREVLRGGAIHSRSQFIVLTNEPLAMERLRPGGGGGGHHRLLTAFIDL